MIMKSVIKTNGFSFKEKWIIHKQYNRILIPAVLALTFFILALALPWHTGIKMGTNYKINEYLMRSEIHDFNGTTSSIDFNANASNYYYEFNYLSYGVLIAIIVAIALSGSVILFITNSMKGNINSKSILVPCLFAFMIIFIALTVYGLRFTPSLNAGDEAWYRDYCGCHNGSCIDCARVGDNDFFKIPSLNKWTWIAYPGLGWFMALFGGMSLVITFVNTLKLHNGSKPLIQPKPSNEKFPEP